MAKINIIIEIDTNDIDAQAALQSAALAFNALGGMPKEAQQEAAIKLVNKPAAEEPKAEANPLEVFTKAFETPKKQKTTKPAAPAADPVNKPVVETEAPKANVTVTIEEVRSAFANAKRSGKDGALIKAVLAKFDVAKVSELKPEHYADAVAAVEAL